MHCLIGNRERLNQEAHGIAQRGIYLRQLSELEIPIPPLSEQQSIVTELDKINELISLKKAQLSDLDSLAQSIFYDMFGDPIENEKGWEVKKLGEMSSVKTGPFGSMLHKEDYISNGIPLVNPIHIKDYRVIADMDFTISDEKARELNAYILRKNDVIFARRGDIGRCAVISDKENGYLCGTGSLFVRFEQKVIPQYIMYIIRSSSFIKELISKAKGATMLNLNSTTIASLGIPLPPLPLQQEFAKRIELIEQQKAQISSTIKDLETLLASRMQYWFD
jgi:type I restriction enzyme S subunit